MFAHPCAYGCCRHGEVSPDQARKEAARLITCIKAGESLEAEAPPPTVANLAERYLREYVDVHNKPATAAHYRLVLGKHIVQALGALVVGEVERKDNWNSRVLDDVHQGRAQHILERHQCALRTAWPQYPNNSSLVHPSPNPPLLTEAWSSLSDTTTMPFDLFVRLFE